MLGRKLVDGVDIRGTRVSYYSSARAKQTGAAPLQVYENWCSISLDSPMGYYVLDLDPKLKHEMTMVFSDIEQNEPDPALFEIPKYYKIVEVESNRPAATPTNDVHYLNDML